MPQTAEVISGKDLLEIRSLRTQTTIDPEQDYQITLYTNDEVQKLPKRKIYTDRAKAILAKAKQLHAKDKKDGVTREESVERFEKIQQKIDDLF